MEFEISLKNVRFYAFHGVLDEERETGNEFVVNFSVLIPFSDQIGEDNIADTVSYAELYEIIAQEMAEPRNLLETVAFSIVKKVKSRFPEILRGHISIEKSRPPIPSMLGQAVVTLHF